MTEVLCVRMWKRDGVRSEEKSWVEERVARSS